MKKLLPILCILFCMTGLTVYGAAPKDADYNGITYDQLKEVAEGLIQELEATDDAARQQIEASGNELQINLLKSYDELKKEGGAFVKSSDFSAAKSKNTVTTTLKLEFEKVSAIQTIVYEYETMQATDITIKKVDTLGVKMQKALLNTLMGMGTVFIMLIVISACISCFRVIPYLENKMKSKNKQPEIVAVRKAPEVLAAPQRAQNDLELAAVITAAIAASTGQSEKDFVVRSIKRR